MNNKVLIVIVTYNAADYIGACLSSLEKVIYQNYEVLIIDNKSADNTVDIIKQDFANIKVISSDDNLGFAGGNNVGFKYALDYNFDGVYLLNQDTEVTLDFLIEAVKLMNSDSKIGAVQSKLMLFQNKNEINSIGNEMHFLGFGFAGGYKNQDLKLEPKEITYPSGAGVLIRCDALSDIGLFNEEFFMYHEDTDLGWRLWLGGYKVMLAPDSVVYHKYEFSRSIKKYYYMERNRYLIILQNYKFATLLLLTPALAAMDLAMILYSFIGGFWREEFRVYSYFFELKNWPKMMAARRSVQSKRKVGDREVVKRFTGKIEFQDVNSPLLKYFANPVFNLYWQIVRNFIWW